MFESLTRWRQVKAARIKTAAQRHTYFTSQFFHFSKVLEKSMNISMRLFNVCILAGFVSSTMVKDKNLMKPCRKCHYFGTWRFLGKYASIFYNDPNSREKDVLSVTFLAHKDKKYENLILYFSIIIFDIYIVVATCRNHKVYRHSHYYPKIYFLK